MTVTSKRENENILLSIVVIVPEHMSHRTDTLVFLMTLAGVLVSVAMALVWYGKR
ncbi:MAG: hypothetical protein FWF41_04540 [Betaproteobacteria bacterium]|nr:hypothetical protein [Betaproteobacteria bacterium]